MDRDPGLRERDCIAQKCNKRRGTKVHDNAHPATSANSPEMHRNEKKKGGGGRLGRIKKTDQCKPEAMHSASLFSMPNLAKPQDTHCV